MIPDLPPDALLESQHAVIGEVVVDNQNIFDPDTPGERTKLFRLANKLHIRSRPQVIANQLLFKPGDPYSRHVLDESERILRSARYLYDASIQPTRYHDGVVDIVVTTKDVWTLNPGASFGRKGGKNTSGFELEELNLLGTGISLSAAHKSGVDRNENTFEIRDRHLLGTWASLSARYSDNSDGKLHELQLDHPFYSLNTNNAWGFDVLDDERVDSLYDKGEIVDQFTSKQKFAETYYGWSKGLREGWVSRWSVGATLDEHRFSPSPLWTGSTVLPQDRRFIYPWVQYDLIQDDFTKLTNHDQIGRTEDFHLGTQLRTRIGWADPTFGSDQSALIFETEASRGLAVSSNKTLVLNAGVNGRLESGELRNTALDAAVRYYVEQSERRLFFANVATSVGRHLDLDQPVMVGGDNGLRGYPLRYQSGSSRAVLTLEQRYFTDWYPFHMFRVGAAVFFDAGRTWGDTTLNGSNVGLLRDIGFGLRFGNSRSGLGNVIHADVAFPLDGEASLKDMQFLIETRERF